MISFVLSSGKYCTFCNYFLLSYVPGATWREASGNEMLGEGADRERGSDGVGLELWLLEVWRERCNWELTGGCGH